MWLPKDSSSAGSEKGKVVLDSIILSTLGEDIKYPNLFLRWSFIWLQEIEAMFKEHKNQVLYSSCTL